MRDFVSYEEGTFIEPLGTVVRGQRIVGLNHGQNVLVIGSGIAGALHVKLAKASGAIVTAADISDYKLSMAKKFGADVAINTMKEKINEKFDAVILCTGAMPAAMQALKCVDKGGTILFFGVPTEDVPMPMNEFWRNSIKITTSYAAAPIDLTKSMELIRSNVISVKDMITHEMPLDEAQKGFNLMASGGECMKVILKP